MKRHSPTRQPSELGAARETLRQLEAGLRSAAGQVGNRVPERAPELELANEELARRLAELERALFDQLTQTLQPRQADEALQQAETLKSAVVEYCRQSQTDPELWKNIAF